MVDWDNLFSNTAAPIINYGTIHENATTYTVTRCCAICTRPDGGVQFSPGSVIHRADFWICQDCCRKIGEVIRNIV